jgi:hypothetical protein
MVMAANIFHQTIRISEYGLSEHIFLTIGILNIGRQIRKTIGLSDIKYQTQTIGLMDIGYKKKLSIAQLWY